MLRPECLQLPLVVFDGTAVSHLQRRQLLAHRILLVVSAHQRSFARLPVVEAVLQQTEHVGKRRMGEPWWLACKEQQGISAH